MPQRVYVALLWLSVWLLGVALLRGVSRAQAEGVREVRARSCELAVELAGQVRCEDAALEAMAALCPIAALATAELQSGDAIDDTLCAAAAPARGAPGWGRMSPERLQILGLPVNVNEASAAELASLPGIGPVLAERVIAGRPYTEVEALRRVRGIGPKKLAALRERARVRWRGD